MESLEITRRAEIFLMFSIPSFHGTQAIFITLLFYFGCAFSNLFFPYIDEFASFIKLALNNLS